MKKILVNVTARDIENGEAGVCSMCPIALALKRKGLKGWVLPVSVMVDGTYVVLPENASDFIEMFDNKKPVKPFKFWLEVGE